LKIQDKEYIKVFNYSPVTIGIETKNRGILFEPVNDGVPTIEHLSFREVEYVDSRSTVFRTGALRFEEQEQEEIFKALKHLDWKETLLSEENITDLVLVSSLENVEKIKAIKDSGTIERVRGRLIYLINEQNDVSTKMEKVIKSRFTEIRNGKLKSEISNDSFKKHINKQQDNVAELKGELDEMKALVAQLLKAQANNNNNTTEKKDNKTKVVKEAKENNKTKEKQ